MPLIDVDAATKRCSESILGLEDTAQAHLHELLQSIADDSEVTDVRWAAYMLATVRHECANRWQPIEEFGRGKNKAYGVPATVQDTDGTSYSNVYYGRGYVQLTWRYNYQKAGQALGLGNALVLHPDHALEPATAYRIMSYGMRVGMFTGKKLADYINASQCDYLNARRIINGIDKADIIQGYAQQFEQLLDVSLVTASGASA